VQFREVVPMGDNDRRVVDVRILAATNRHIHEAKCTEYCGGLRHTCDKSN
jgi:transcriptional regulator with PAS, ATPase and Fis domain